MTTEGQANIPIVVLDWDYETFSTDRVDKFWLFDEEIWKDRPNFVYLEGWPAPGWELPRTLAKRVGDTGCCYQLVRDDTGQERRL